VAAMVAEANAPFVVPPGDEEALGRALATLAADPAKRRAIGAANQALARKDYDEGKMIARYKALYWALMGRQAT
jgi:glycosyltransferase involved in cell wall biosynthesis